MMNSERKMSVKTSKEKQSQDKLKTVRHKSHDVVMCETMEEEGSLEDLDNKHGEEAEENPMNIYKINYQFLKSVCMMKSHIPQPPPDKPTKKVMVRKAVPADKCPQRKLKKKVLVAKPLSIDEQENAVVRSEPVTPVKDNILKPHKILGSVEEYLMEAAKSGNTVPLYDEPIRDEGTKLPNKASAKGRSRSLKMGLDETNALNNWGKHMAERKKQQSHLSKQMMVESDMLVMHQSDMHRHIQEERTVIDRAMPSKDYGKGYRVGSEFWKQVEAIGGDDGISITLNKTEKGDFTPIEHIGHPASVKEDMGTKWAQTRRMTNIHYPWWKSSYLEERKSYLEDVITELDPFTPDLNGLEIVGRSIHSSSGDRKTADDILTGSIINGDDQNYNGTKEDNEENKEEDMVEEDGNIQCDPLAQFDNVIPQPIFGPSLLINGHSATWEGSYNVCNHHVVGLSVRLLFDAMIGGSATSCIDITNNGTTAVHYLWTKPPANDPFNLKKDNPCKKFYFNVCNGVVLPGNTVSIPFSFKSVDAGIFSERWLLETQPILLAGQQMEIVLKGIATKEDLYDAKRKEIEDTLIRRQNERMARRIVNELLVGIKTPSRPSTPEGAYLTEKDVFDELNEKVHYKSDVVTRLKTLNEEVVPENQWDYSLNSLIKNVKISVDEEVRETNLERLNAELVSLTTLPEQPIEKSNDDSCYQILCECIDKIVMKSVQLRSSLDLPEKEFLLLKSEVVSKKLKKPGGGELQSKSRAESSRNRKERPSSPRNKTPLKDKTAKEKAEAAAQNTGKLEPNDSVTTQKANDMKDPVYNKYLEKFHLEVYNVLADAAVTIEALLSN